MLHLEKKLKRYLLCENVGERALPGDEANKLYSILLDLSSHPMSISVVDLRIGQRNY